jgi:hypothetical protein
LVPNTKILAISTTSQPLQPHFQISLLIMRQGEISTLDGRGTYWLGDDPWDRYWIGRDIRYYNDNYKK